VAEDDLTLLAIADGLYALAPEGFTEARGGRVAKARGEGQSEVANVIKTWRRPKTSAWLLNMLVRQRADRLSQMFELDAALRDAQHRGDGERLRALSRQRRKTVDGLILEARKLADRAGHRISESVVHEVEATLQAALADPRAAEAVRTGRLVTALSSNGFDPVNLDGAVVLLTEPDPTTFTVPRNTVADAARTDEARAAVRDAAAVAAQAEQELSATERTLHSAAAKVDELRSRVTALEGKLAEARSAADAGNRDLRAARSARDTAEHDVRIARRRMAAAESELERLGS
jgi:hypothetical protein